MPTVIEKTVYAFDELSDRAKETARDWWRQCEAESGDNYFAEAVIEDAATCADIIGLDIRQTRKNRVDGTHVYVPTVYWSGFSHQGQGACFDGSYAYKKGAAQAIRKHAPQDERLNAIADQLQRIQSRHFYKLTARIKSNDRYMSLNVDAEHSDDSYRDIGDAESDFKDAFESFAHWIFVNLRDEYEYSNADEQVDENIRANEYQFNEDGSIN